MKDRSVLESRNPSHDKTDRLATLSTPVQPNGTGHALQPRAGRIAAFMLAVPRPKDSRRAAQHDLTGQDVDGHIRPDLHAPFLCRRFELGVDLV